MRTTLAALAGAGAALASYTPDSYTDNSLPPAYGGDESSSSSSSSSSASKSVYTSATSSTNGAASSGTPDFPSCWSSCFKEAGVTSPAATCGNSELDSCIEKSCSSDDADKYKSWLAEECGSASTSSNVVGPTGSMSHSHGPTGYPSSSSLSGYPHGPSGYVPKPSGYASSSGSPGGYGNCTTTYSSVCTETETLIYRSTTEYVPTTITHIFTTNLPSGSCSNVPYAITSSSSIPYSPVQPSEYPSGGNGGYGSSPASPVTTTTDVETIYTTVCPYTETTESDGQTYTSVYETTSEVTSTYQTTVVVTPTSPATATTPGSGVPTGLPGCWNVCFTKNGATSQQATCTNDAVSECIKELCTADESSQFESWKSDYCSGVGSGSNGDSGEGSNGGEGGSVGGEGSAEGSNGGYGGYGGSDGGEGYDEGSNGGYGGSDGGEGSGEGSEGSDGGSNGGYGGSEDGNGDSPSNATGPYHGVPSEYTSISPVTKPFTYGDWTSYYTDFETVTLTSHVTSTAMDAYPTGGADSPTDGSPAGGESSPTGGYGGSVTSQTQTYETGVTTAYTTVCTASESEGLTTSTVTTTSTVSLTFTVPASTPTGGEGNSPGSPSIPDCWGKCFAKNDIMSEQELCGDIDTETCIKAECPYDSYSAYEAWLNEYCGKTSTTSGIVGPTGSGYPQPSGSVVYPQPSGSVVYPQPSGSGVYPPSSGYPQPSSGVHPPGTGVHPPSGTGVHPTGTGVHPTGTGVHPTGTGVGPTGTGVGPTATSPATTSSTCSLPTPTASCKRCEGQPGDDKFCGLDINTNIYKDGNAPITCETVEVEWEITTGMVSPDGVERMAILINGQTPGPMLEANWGDEIVVHVKNSMPKGDLNGTTIHWHGIHQKGTVEFDGTPSLTQCPIAPGETFTYKFRATQYGSSWYHSHFALQAYDGLYGPMTIHGPVQEGYEYDGEEFVTLQDWRHAPLTEIYHNLELVSNGQRSSPTLDNGLINGMNTWENGGKRWTMNVQKGKTYRLRVLNAAIQSTFKFYIDGHSFKVIAADFVPIEPFETNIININNGQRYDVIFTADQDISNYWMRSDVQAPCSNVTNGLDVKAIVHYEGAPDAVPTSQAYAYTPECIDEPAANLVPIVPWNAGASSDEIDKDVLIVPNGGNPNLFKWTLSGTAFFSQWSDPTLQSIYDDGTVPTYSGDLAIREDNLGEWIYVIIDSVIPLPHPIHLHGHDFLVLGQGIGPYNPATATLNLQNPPRRDTAIMPFQLGPGAVGGYLVVAFYTDNPGVWLMHCHIGWHNAMGFALQIIEGLADIKETVDFACQMEDNCAAWHAYAEEYDILTTDSGI